MKDSQLNILIANMFLVGALLNQDVIGSFMMLIIGIMWMFFGIMSMRGEFELWRLENRLENSKRKYFQSMFELLIEILEKPKKKKRSK